MTIGERLKIVRGTRSRREVASLVGMKQQAWAIYEGICGGNVLVISAVEALHELDL